MSRSVWSASSENFRVIADAVLDVLHAELPSCRGERTLELVAKVSGNPE